ncbi:MAG: MFS transporter [Anaerolineae bacterium]
MNLRALRDHPLLLPYFVPEFILAVSWGLLVPVLPVYAKEFGAGYAVIGLLLGGEALGMLLGDVPAGLWMRQLGTKPTMLLGGAGAVLATAGLFFAPTIGVAIALRMLAGFSRSMYSVARHAYLAMAASQGARGRAFAFAGGLQRIGNFVGPALGGLTAEALGLRASFLVFGGVALAALGALAAYAPATATRDVRQPARVALGLLWQTVVGHYRVLLKAGAGQILAQTIRAGRSAIIPLYAADVLGLDVTAIGLIVSLSSAVDMALFYPAGLLMDRLGRKAAIVPSFVVQAVGMALIPLSHSYGGLLAVASLIGLGNGLGSGSMMTLGADLAPRETRGEFLGVWRLIGDGGSSLGPLLVGQVSDLLALPAAALVMAVAGLGAGLIFALGVPEPGRSPAEARRGRAVG